MPPSTYLRQKLKFQEVTLRVQLPSTDFGEFLGSKTLADPILPVLGRTLAAGPCADLAFICGARGHPLTKESFGNAFKEAGSAKLGQREPLRTEQQSPSLKRYSDGAAAGWPLSTRAKPTGHDCPRARSASSKERPRNILFPHLMIRCGLQEKIPNEINAKFWEWCGREDSNLHGLPR